MNSRCVLFNETENYMKGYRVVFDREKLVLAWKKFDCKFLSSSNVFARNTYLCVLTYLLTQAMILKRQRQLLPEQT